MERFLSDQSSMTSVGVVNYRSSSYGGYLFRCPNSPPHSPSPSPSPSPSSPPSIASLNQHFLCSRFNCRSGSPAYRSSRSGLFQSLQPPLLPLPRTPTLPMPSKRILAGIPASTVRARKQNAKKKGKAITGVRKEIILPPPSKMKEEWKPSIAAMEEEIEEWNPLKMVKKEKMKLIEEEEERMMKLVFSLSPPPSCLPIPKFSSCLPTPKFSVSRPKANFDGGGVHWRHRWSPATPED